MTCPEVQQVRDSFHQAKERMLNLLETTPDERLNWSPSESARSILELVVHSGMAIRAIQDQLDGIPFQFTSTAEADVYFRNAEKAETSREGAREMFMGHAQGFEAWLDDLTPEKLAGQMILPFGMGSAPLAIAIGFPAMHTNHHSSQIEYVQTIYGDRDWR